MRIHIQPAFLISRRWHIGQGTYRYNQTVYQSCLAVLQANSFGSNHAATDFISQRKACKQARKATYGRIVGTQCQKSHSMNFIAAGRPLSNKQGQLVCWRLSTCNKRRRLQSPEHQSAERRLLRFAEIGTGPRTLIGIHRTCWFGGHGTLRSQNCARGVILSVCDV